MKGTESAKQFLPYAALKGYDAAVDEVRGEYYSMRLWGPDRAEELDRQLRSIAKGDCIKAVRYRDGEEETVCGKVTSIDLFECFIKIESEKIPFGCIYSIERV